MEDHTYSSYHHVCLLLIPPQITLFWRRALNDPGYRRIFCLIHAEKLLYSVADSAVQALQELSKGRKGIQSYNAKLVAYGSAFHRVPGSDCVQQ